MINLKSFDTWFPAFVGFPALTSSNSYTLPSSIPTLPASAASRLYVWFRVSSTTASSKYSVCFLKSASLKSQNLSGAMRRTATAASWTSVEDGCQGCTCGRKMTCSFEAYFWAMIGRTWVWKVLKTLAENYGHNQGDSFVSSLLFWIYPGGGRGCCLWGMLA